MGVLVNDQLNSNSKPGKMFDDDTATTYHNGWNTGKLPGVKVYFGYEVDVSRVKIINRLDVLSYLKNLENTVVSVMLKDGGVDECGILTEVNTVSQSVEDQTYTVFCGNTKGIGLSVQRPSTGNRWCISELEIYHFTGTVH